jgi:hypothetical protein
MKIPVQQALHYYTEISEFKFLGSLVTYDNYCGKDVSARITAGNQFYQALSKFMKPRYVSKHTKLIIYTTVIII